MGFRDRSKEAAEREAQFWWAFSCLVLAGRRTAADFHSEVMRRGSGLYATEEEAEQIVDEAVAHLASVFNAALENKGLTNGNERGWNRHILALTMSPEDARNPPLDE